MLKIHYQNKTELCSCKSMAKPCLTRKCIVCGVILYAHFQIVAQRPEEMCLSLEHQTCRKPLKKWVILIALQFCYTFYIQQTKRLRARKIGLQYEIRKGRKQIWGRFSNPWNSNGIEWNRLILLTWSRILMYLPNTVGKRHKKAFKFIFGDRNLRLQDSTFVRCAPQQMMTEMT